MEKRQFPKWLLWLDVIYAGLLVVFKFALNSVFKFIVKQQGVKGLLKVQTGIMKIGTTLSSVQVILAVLGVNVLVLIFSMMRKRGAKLKNGSAQPIIINNQGSTTNMPVKENSSSQNSDGNMNFF